MSKTIEQILYPKPIDEKVKKQKATKKKEPARKKRIVGEGTGVYKTGEGIIETLLGGKTEAQTKYIKHPSFKR